MANYLKYTAKQFEQLMEQIYSGSITPRRLPVDLYATIYDRLKNAVDRGMGAVEFDVGSPDDILSRYYKHNIGVFSGAKTHQQVKDMSNFVFTADGFKRDFSEFKQYSKKIFDQYNDAWLRTEYDTAFRTAQMGRQWNEYVQDADVFPYLKYVTARDERVRHDHQQFDGITLPIGHKFWNTHTPPNGFNCRCRLIQLSDDDNPVMSDPGVVDGLPRPDQPLFEFNPGKHGYIFDESKHPYTVKIGERFKTSAQNNFGLPTPPKPTEPIPKPPKPLIRKPKKGIKTATQTIAGIKTESDAQKMIGKIANKNNFKIDNIEIDFNVIGIERAKEYITEMERLLDKYEIPEFRRKNGVRKMVFESKPTAWGSVTSLPSTIFEWRPGHATDVWKRARKRDLESQFYRGKSAVDEKNASIATMTHEFAHVLSVTESKHYTPQMKMFWSQMSTIKRRYNKRLKEIKKIPDETTRLREMQKTYLGNYAGTNADEFFAEGFTEYELSSDPSPFAVQIGELVEKTFGKKKK